LRRDLTVSEPDDDTDLDHELDDRSPSLTAYAVSLVVIRMMGVSTITRSRSAPSMSTAHASR
jgi:hypothetical protein